MTAWYDGPCVVAEAPHQKAAYAFINHMLSPEIQARLPKELGYAPANSKAIPMLDAETKKDMDIDALVANIDKIQFQYNLGADFDKRGIEMWERAKATTVQVSRSKRDWKAASIRRRHDLCERPISCALNSDQSTRASDDSSPCDDVSITWPKAARC